jgi:hypothetical protein
MKTLLFLIALIVVGVLWGLNRAAATNLQREVNALRVENSELAAVNLERERLQRLHDEATRRVASQRDASQSVRPAPATAAPAPSALVVGEWHAPASWQNRGQATPVAAIETALWAAAGGDLAALQNLLLLDDALRAKADALRARLPGASRATYASAEHLLSAFATKSLPLGDAQLVWNHQPDADEAFACLFVKNPEFVPTPSSAESPPPMSREAAIARAAAIREARSREKRPPMAPANEATRALYLILRRTDTGWRFVVSPGAIDKIAKEIGTSP